MIDKLFMLLNDENWKSDYVFWELNLLKYIGFDLNLIDYCKYDEIENKKKYFIESTSKKLKVPNFLVENIKEDISDRDIYDSLNLISEYMKKNIFIPNNINFPTSRVKFINYFK